MTDGTGRDRRRGTPRRGSGVGHVHAVLREEILGLRLPPGSPIDEATLSERFRLSRTPIREALVRLDAGGLVTTLHNRATVVAQIDFLDLPSFFDALRLMARATARGAALQHGPAELVRIRRAQRDVVRALEAGDRAAVIAADHAFHLCIAGAARNRHFEALSLRLLDEGRRLTGLCAVASDLLPTVAGLDAHAALVAAIAARDADRSDVLAAGHADAQIAMIRARVAADRRWSAAMKL